MVKNSAIKICGNGLLLKDNEILLSSIDMAAFWTKSDKRFLVRKWTMEGIF